MSTARRKEGISLTLLLSRRISSSFVSSRSSLSSSLLLFHLVFFSFSYTVFDKPGAGLSLALRPSPPHPPLSSFFSSSFTSPCPASVASPSSPSSPSSFSSSPLSFSVPLPRLRRPSTASRLWTFPRLSVRNRRHDSLFLRSRRCLQKARRSERRGRDSRTLLLFLSSVGTAQCPSGCGRRARGPASLDRWKAKQYRHSRLSASPCASPLFSSSSFLFRSSSLFSPPLSLDAASFASSPVLFRRRLPSASSLSSVSSLSSLSSFSSFSSFLSPFSLPLAFPSCSSSSSLGLQHRSGVTPHVRPTEETIETVEISDGFLTEEEEQKAHYPFVDAPLNLLVDPTPLRKEMEARQRRRQRLSLLQSLAASPLSPQAQHALHVSRQSDSTNTATDAGEENETPGDSETECEAVDPVPPDVR
ncbi:hypothetical protein TGP89_231360A, partial [Toxoplasma gondii p89]